MLSICVLNIANFGGNIGDNANHMGFYPWMESLSGLQIQHALDKELFTEFAPAGSVTFFCDPNVRRIVTVNIASDTPETHSTR